VGQMNPYRISRAMHETEYQRFGTLPTESKLGGISIMC
jgi:hypothetical protein